MADVFISYSRKDMAFVRRLSDALEQRQREAWVDWEGIRPTEEFMLAIYAAIEGTNTFIFILTPDSVGSEVCAKEIAHATKHNKRFIPIVQRDIDAKSVPETLAKLNWIFCREADDFAAAVESLIDALDTDLDWVRAHTRLLARAIEWEAKAKNNSFVLRGDDLRAAEQWLAQAGIDKERQPTALQTEYIIASRKAAGRRQRLILGATIFGLAIAIALAVLAWFQRNEARAQAQIALARQLAAQADSLRQSELDHLPSRSALLALEAMSHLITAKAFSIEVDHSLREALSLLPQHVTFATVLGQTSKHSTSVVVISPDNRSIASAFGDGTAKIWEVSTGREIARPRDSGLVYAIVFSPDGKALATISQDRPVRVWDTKSGQIISTLPDQGKVIATVFSPDLRYLVTANEDQTACVWDVSSNAEAKRLPKKGLEEAMAFSPDGNFLAVANYDQTLVYNVRDNWQIVADLPKDGLSNAIAFSKNGKLLAVSPTASGTQLWSVEGWKRAFDLPIDGHLFFSADGDSLTISHHAGFVTYDTHTGQELGSIIADPRESIQKVIFSPDEKLLAMVSDACIIRVYSVAYHRVSNKDLIARMPHDEAVWDISFSSDGKFLTTASRDETARVWQLPPGFDELTYTDQSGSFPKAKAIFSSDGRHLVISSKSAFVPIWELASRQEIARATHDDGVIDISVSPDGKLLATASVDKTVGVWDVNTGRRIQTFALDGTTGPVVFSADGKYLAAASLTSLVIWQVSTWNVMTRLSITRGTFAIAFSPDSRLLAATSENSALVWEIPKAQPIARLDHAQSVQDLAFSPDGKFIATAGADKIAVVWKLYGLNPSRGCHIRTTLHMLSSARIASYLQLAAGRTLREYGGSPTAG